MNVASNLTRAVFGGPVPPLQPEIPTAELPVGPIQRRGMMSELLAPVQNVGEPERDAEQLAEWLDGPEAGSGPVALVGWSLGGVICREVARALPEKVSTVVTFGTPVIGGPTHTLGAEAFGEEECRRIAELIIQTEKDDPIRVPMTSIYTRRDAVVDWRACIDRTSEEVNHVEVGSTHIGLGIDPDVWSTVARALNAHA